MCCSIWIRHNLENFKKRLKALEEKVANDGVILSDAQVSALEKEKQDDEATDEIETPHPGYLSPQDTFYVGHIYQQTFVDTYSKVVFAKLYTTKTPITAADALNDKGFYHKAILNEFYQVAFRKKLYETIEDLQKYLDDWIKYYNNDRTHQGKMCCGRTPVETLLDGKSIWAEKKLAQI